MAIIWGILLWILIIFLAIIGLIVVVFLILCFLPIKYYFILDGDKENFKCELKINILGFLVFPREKKKKKIKKKKIKKKEEVPKEEVPKEEVKKIKTRDESEKLEKTKKPQKNILKKLEKLEKEWKLIENFNFSKLTSRIKKITKKIAKNLKPKLFNIKAEIGIDPYKTGLLIAFISFLNLDDNIQINGNYEEEILKGSIEIGGILKLIYFIGPSSTLIIPLLKLYLYRKRRLKQCKKNLILE